MAFPTTSLRLHITALTALGQSCGAEPHPPAAWMSDSQLGMTSVLP